MASIVKQSVQDFITQGNTITGLQDVAVWNNQLESVLAGSETVLLPGIFFERLFDPAVPYLMNVRQVDFYLNIHIIHNQVDAGDGTQGQNLDVFDLRDEVVRKFNGFKATGCGVLQYFNESEDFNHNNVYHYIVTFRAAMVDTTGSLWDENNGKWIEKQPPTDLEITVQPGAPYLKNLS